MNMEFGWMIKLFCSSYVGDIVEFCQSVLVSGRYGHGNHTKPVNMALSALHRFQSYIISVCF